MRVGSNKTHILEARFRGSNERIVGSDGNINAGSNKEIMARLLEIASMVKEGEIASGDEMSAKETAAQQREAIRSAYYDDAEWAELGSAIGAEINTRIEREGFLRTLFDSYDVAQGSVPRYRVREPNVRAVLSRGPVQVYPQFVRDKYITADEWYVVAQPRVEEIDLNQGSSNLLEDKYFEGMEAILIQEDRTAIALFDGTVGIYNDVTYFSTLTPSIIQLTKYNVERWRLPAAAMLLSIDLMNDIIAGNDFSTFFNPVTNYELVMTGRIGNLFGMQIITDGFREPTLQVLEQGSMYVVTSPNMLGGYTDRGPVNARPVDMHDQFVPARGWSLWEIISMTLANARGVAKAQRI